MSPLDERGADGGDRGAEREGESAAGGARAGEGGAADGGGSCRAAFDERAAGQEDLEEVPGRGGQGAGASVSRAAVESEVGPRQQAAESGALPDAAGRVWADSGGRETGRGGAEGFSRDAASVADRRGAVEEEEETGTAPQVETAEGALRRAGADGRELPRLARDGREAVLDRHG